MRPPVLLPQPRSVRWGEESLRLGPELPLVLTAWQQALLPAAHRLQQLLQAGLGLAVPLRAAAPAGGPAITVAAATLAHSQAYRLSAGPGGIDIAAGTAAGARFGLITAGQLLLGCGGDLPFVEIADQPDFERRGVLLDVSRGKVPTLPTLLAFVDWLAELKLNELQLYTEHTFAYAGHATVWEQASPFTGEEILRLDCFCRERGIDLVPNQNSFGHMNQWLRHERYRHLAEKPDAAVEWGGLDEGPGTLCPLDPVVPQFLAGLYDELLPHFSSAEFNVGCDETWELGEGRSQAAVQERGAGRVYLEFLHTLHALVSERGRRMQFWSDIITNHPDLLGELPTGVTVLEWGYEANHRFDERCACLAAAGLRFYVCPGASNWNSIGGRTDNALANLAEAAVAGQRHGAAGYLITVWGDKGYLDYQPISYLPIAYGAAQAWASSANAGVDVRPYLNERVFADASQRIGSLLFDLGNVYLDVGRVPHNSSLLGTLLQHGFAVNFGLFGVTDADFDRAAQHLWRLGDDVRGLQLGCADGALVTAELRASVRLLLHACAFGRLRLRQLAGQAPERAAVQALADDLEAIIDEHRRLWLARNRPGGLAEVSLRPLSLLRAGYAALL